LRLQKHSYIDQLDKRVKFRAVPAAKDAKMIPATDKARALPTALGEKVAQALRAVSQGYDSYGLLDFPSHWNIGDSAIWQGEAEVLRRVHGKAPRYVSHVRYAIEEVGRSLPETALIYLHGGGNFGDIWPAYQRYREAVLQRYPHHRIVQLPQSLHYRDQAGIEVTKRAIAGHRDFHLMVRDHKSFDLASTHFDCEVLLVPDSAFGIDMSGFAFNPAPQGIGCIFRSDQERRPDAASGAALFGTAGSEDWRHHGPIRKNLEKAALGAFMLAPKALTGGLRGRAFDAMARARVTMGLTQIDRHEVLVTDRLHGHIMATLLGKPHVVIDNFYGKIANFIKAFGKDEVTLSAENFAQAHEMAQQLLEQARAKS
jgi:exopolysaccharide biosynthesis predicted pyruvyltransferase EpsI